VIRAGFKGFKGTCPGQQMFGGGGASGCQNTLKINNFSTLGLGNE